jgi:hypothetical protein
VRRLCIGGERADKCDAPQVCPLCECCEDHCLSSGSGNCVEAHDDWLVGGPGGMVEVVASALLSGRRPFGPERTLGTKGDVLRAQNELAEENGLRHCSGCRGLEDPARPHRH